MEGSQIRANLRANQAGLGRFPWQESHIDEKPR